jgi:hypothetical protein
MPDHVTRISLRRIREQNFVTGKTTKHAGKAALGAHYAKHRFNLPELHARLLNRIVSGNIVVDQEEVTGVPGGVMAAVAVYRVERGRIQAVWFF